MFLSEILSKNAGSKKVALEYKHTRLTFKKLNELSILLSTHLDKADNNIGILLPNSLKYAIAFFGIAFSDKTIVPINPYSTFTEITEAIRYCDISTIITDNDNKNKLVKYAKNMKIAIITINDKLSFFSEFFSDLKISVNVHERSKDNTALILRTSGTTENPKYVMLSHKNVVSNMLAHIEAVNLTEKDRSLIILPMYFCYCLTSQFLAHIYLHAFSFIYDESFMANRIFQTIRNYKITNISCVASMLLIIEKFCARFNNETGVLRKIFFGAGFMPQKELAVLIKKFPSIEFIHTYGLTEASPRVTTLLHKDSLRKIGSIGKPFPNLLLKIIDEDNNELEYGREGEIVIKGPGVMIGYYKNPDETEKAICNEWLYTGDMGKRDEEGYIYLTGRKKNIIISGGINIHPEEIEKVLLQCPLVSDVIVVSGEHEILGEVPIAKVICENAPSSQELNDLWCYCKANLSEAKIPYRVDIVKSIQKTYTGKSERKRC